MANTKAFNVVSENVVLTPIDRIDSEGTPWLCIQGRHIPGVVTTAIDGTQLSRAVEVSATAVIALVEDGRRAVILGFLAPSAPVPADDKLDPTKVTLDGKSLILSGREDITLRCGKASITLTRAGKILLRGAYLSSRSSGVNRIKGGSVQIN